MANFMSKFIWNIKHSGISGKLMAVSVLCIITAVSLCGGIGYLVAYQTLLGRMEAVDIPNIVQIKADRIEARLSRAIETSMLLSTDPVLKAWFESGDRSSEGELAKKRLTSVRDSGAYFTVFAISNRTYNYWIADGKLLQTISRSDPDDKWFFENISNKKRVQINIDYNPKMGDTFVFINVMMGDLEKPLGITGVGLKLSDVVNTLFGKAKGYDDNTYLIDRNGSVVIASDATLIGKKCDLLFGEESSSKILNIKDGKGAFP